MEGVHRRTARLVLANADLAIVDQGFNATTQGRAFSDRHYPVLGIVGQRVSFTTA
jgi:hypothetical protein